MPSSTMIDPVRMKLRKALRTPRVTVLMKLLLVALRAV
jgi:hypothetical protein